MRYRKGLRCFIEHGGRRTGRNTRDQIKASDIARVLVGQQVIGNALGTLAHVTLLFQSLQVETRGGVLETEMAGNFAQGWKRLTRPQCLSGIVINGLLDLGQCFHAGNIIYNTVACNRVVYLM